MAGAYAVAKISESSFQLSACTSAIDFGIFGSTTFGLANPTKSLSKQGLDGLDPSRRDPGTEISCRKPLPHSGQVQVAHALSGGARRGLEQNASDRLDLLGRGQSQAPGARPRGS